MVKRFGMDFFRSVCYNKTRLHTILFRMVLNGRGCSKGDSESLYHRKWRYSFKIMVNKVDGNNYYVYTKQKKIDVPDTGEKFDLGYNKNESSSDAKDKKEISEQEKQQAAERSGVMLELSGRRQNAEADGRKQSETSKEQSTSEQVPLLETIREYVMAAIAAVREFFHSIWSDSQSEDAVSDILQDASQEGLQELSEESSPDSLQEPVEFIDASDERSVAAMDEERRNREIQQSLRDRDMEHVIRLLTDNGKRTIAKNSTLLTSYDRNGRVIEPNASDREKALYGNRNTWEL